jgi:hypothetical protein
LTWSDQLHTPMANGSTAMEQLLSFSRDPLGERVTDALPCGSRLNRYDQSPGAGSM